MPRQDTLPDLDTIWNYNDPAETEGIFRNLVPRAKDADNPSYLAQLLTQIGRTLGMQGKFDEAHEMLDQTESLLGAEPLPRIRWLLERGRTFNSSGQKPQAVELFERALELAQPSGEDFYAIDAAHMLALAAPQEAQVEWARKALDLAEQTECERAAGWAAALYNNLGWTYHNLERYDEALVQFEKGLAYRQDRAQEGRPVHIARWCIARTLRSLGKLEQAIEQQTQLLEVHDSGFVHEELGECLLALGRDEESVDYFAQAYHMLSKDDWLAHDEPDRLARLKKLGWVPAHE